MQETDLLRAGAHDDPLSGSARPNRLSRRRSMTAGLSRAFALLLPLLAVTACGRAVDTDTREQVRLHDAALKNLPEKFYRPGLGDMMNALQLRHAKLWYAGAAGNWELASFEAHEIEESLERIAHWHAVHDEAPIASYIEAYMHPGHSALEQSIAKQDMEAFTTAFDQFTQGCNDCHRATGHAFISIQRPTADSFPNQRWTPEGGR